MTKMGDMMKLQALQLDALREVANIGAGHAATALSQLTGRRVMISVPEVNMATREELATQLGGPSEEVVAVTVQILGDLTGHTMLVLTQANARSLCNFLLGEQGGADADLNDHQISTLREAGNILGSAYLTALANLLNMILLPSVPTVTRATWGAVLDQAGHKDASVVLCASAKFRMSDPESPSLIGRLLHMPDSASLATILKTIGVEFG